MSVHCIGGWRGFPLLAITHRLKRCNSADFKIVLCATSSKKNHIEICHFLPKMEEILCKGCKKYFKVNSFLIHISLVDKCKEKHFKADIKAFQTTSAAREKVEKSVFRSENTFFTQFL